MFYGQNTADSRHMTGFELLRSGAEVATAWGFDRTKDTPYNDSDGEQKDRILVSPGADELTPTICWELRREGMDDCQYMATLHKQSGEAKARDQTAAAERAEHRLRPLIDPDAPGIEGPLAFSQYRCRISRVTLALRQDREERELAVSFAAMADNPVAPTRLGANLVGNPSFENPTQPDGTPPCHYYLGYPKPNETPAEALIVTDEAGHSGRFSLK